MINQTGIPPAIYGDIFFIREKLINDILLKNKLDKIRYRPIIGKKISNCRKKKKSLHKNTSSSELVLPNIYYINQLKSHQSNYISKSTRNNSLIINSSYNIEEGSSPSNLNPILGNNNLKNNSPSYDHLNTNNNKDEKSNHSKHKSVISNIDNLNNNFLFSYSNSNNELVSKKILDSNRRKNLNKFLEIEKENDYFSKKLQKVNSILDREKLNSAYAKSCEYRNIAKKAKTNKEIKERTDNYIKYHLPPIFINKNISSNKLDNMSNSSLSHASES